MKNANAECGRTCKPRRARPEAHIYGVVLLVKDRAIHCEARLVAARFRSRRDISALFRGTLATGCSNHLIIAAPLISLNQTGSSWAWLCFRCRLFAQRTIAPCIVLHFARCTQRLGGYSHVGDVVKRQHSDITAAQVVVDHTQLNIPGA